MELFAKHMFKKFRRACKEDRHSRKVKAVLLKKQKEFYEFNSKRRAIYQIMKNVNDSHLNRIKREYVT